MLSALKKSDFLKPVFHKKIIDNLLSLIKADRVGHAYIFEGESGLLKKETAEFFARALLCEKNENSPCGACKSCVLFASGNNPDFSCISVGEAQGRQFGGKNLKTIPVSAIREAKKDIYERPFAANRKVYIIYDAHLMTIQAQNSLLKVLEEPPAYCTIIMVTDSFDKLLPTVISRSVRVHFSPLLKDELLAWQKEEINASEKELLCALPLCEGNPAKLLSILTDKDSLKLRQDALSKLPLLLSGSPADINKFITYILKNKENMLPLFAAFESYIRDILFIKSGQNAIINQADVAALKKHSEKISAKTCTMLISALSYIADSHINHNAQIELCMASALMGIY